MATFPIESDCPKDDTTPEDHCPAIINIIMEGVYDDLNASGCKSKKVANKIKKRVIQCVQGNLKNPQAMSDGIQQILSEEYGRIQPSDGGQQQPPAGDSESNENLSPMPSDANDGERKGASEDYVSTEDGGLSPIAPVANEITGSPINGQEAFERFVDWMIDEYRRLNPNAPERPVFQDAIPNNAIEVIASFERWSAEIRLPSMLAFPLPPGGLTTFMSANQLFSGVGRTGILRAIEAYLSAQRFGTPEPPVGNNGQLPGPEQLPLPTEQPSPAANGQPCFPCERVVAVEDECGEKILSLHLHFHMEPAKPLVVPVPPEPEIAGQLSLTLDDSFVNLQPEESLERLT